MATRLKFKVVTVVEEASREGGMHTSITGLLWGPGMRARYIPAAELSGTFNLI